MPAAAGHECERCPEGVVHLPDEKLCTACHRSADEKGFTHLGEKRVDSAAKVLAELSEPDAASAVRSYHPKVADCLCRRNDCLIQILTQREKKGSPKACLECKNSYPSNPSKGRRRSRGCGRWYPVVASEGVAGSGLQREST